MRQGHLPGSHWDWQSGADFTFTKDFDDQAAGGTTPNQVAPQQASDASAAASCRPSEADIHPGWHQHPASNPNLPSFWAHDLSIPRRLASADGFKNPFTNYVRGYTGALDYVLYDPGELSVVRQIPLPSEDELQGWIPSQCFPSDHLAVCHECSAWCCCKHGVHHAWRGQATPLLALLQHFAMACTVGTSSNLSSFVCGCVTYNQTARCAGAIAKPLGTVMLACCLVPCRVWQSAYLNPALLARWCLTCSQPAHFQQSAQLPMHMNLAVTSAVHCHSSRWPTCQARRPSLLQLPREGLCLQQQAA